MIIMRIFSAVPNCQDYLDCESCAVQDECAWCASENVCTTQADAFSRDCRGLVFDLPCPANFVAGEFVSHLALFVLINYVE